MEKYYLAIDIGASGGRHILGCIKNNKLVLEEIYRFANSMDEDNGTLYWNVDLLFEEIITGMMKCKEIGKIPESVGVDTWGVDFALLDKEDRIIGHAVGYRDHRTDGIDKEVYKIIDEAGLYKRTGIQKAIYNTIYQLAALNYREPVKLNKAETLLLMPDYFHFRLSGQKVCEYTEATTTQLVNSNTGDWDYELINMLGFPTKIFQKILMPGSYIGKLSEEVQRQVGYNCKVVLPPSHDTASAVLAVPSNSEDTCYISSGTWSLMGVETDSPDCSEKSREANFTNEGGYNGKITYLTNIMGLWMIQSVRNRLAPNMSYEELSNKASLESINSIVDCQDERFLSPDDMVEAVKEYCRKTNQTIPESLPEIACVIYNSLAKCYADKLSEIEKLMGKKYDTINIVGGGSNSDYLNRLTAKYTGARVVAGPSEGTAIGNILSQMIQGGVFKNVAAARKCVAESFEVKTYN